MKSTKKNISNAQLAYDKIKYMILSGKVVTNSRLIPADLEHELGIGRVPIREALLQLGRTGLVVNIPYKGALVAAAPTIEEIKDIFQLKIQLEPKLAVRGLEKLNTAQIKTIKKVHKKMCSSTVKSDNYFHLNKQFHFLIYEASGLHHLCLIANKIQESVESFRTIYKFERKNFEEFNKEHEEILKHIDNHDAKALAKGMISNITSGRDTLLDAYQKIQSLWE